MPSYRTGPRRVEYKDPRHDGYAGQSDGISPPPGQAHDLIGADKLLVNTPADTLLADKAYDAQERLIYPREKAGKQVVIPLRSKNLVQRRGDWPLYQPRHLIENFFAKLKPYRAIATRYDKTARNFLAAIHLAASVIWLNQKWEIPRLCRGTGKI